MKKLIRFTSLFMLAVFISSSAIFGQQDSAGKRSLKNTIRINITNPLIFGDRYFVVGYERVIFPNQTASINLGRFSFPKFSLINTGDLEIQKDYKDKGFHVSVDYRFYLKSLNKFDAPRGVYLGPFYSYNYFNRENKWNYHTDTFDGELISDLTLNIHSLGAQLGYQFVFWRRLSVDLVLFGPGVGFYGAKARLNTDLSIDDEAEFFQKLNELLADKFPGYNQIIGSNEFEKKGSFQLTSLGFRYMIHLGFRF
ncbi:MAG: DUF3575 domain-containing protein [Bacteroidales bacterium]|nr:DUF3575 domain-containing protein [Bacteroidales bacterium]